MLEKEALLEDKLRKWLALVALQFSAMSPPGANHCEEHLPMALIHHGCIY